MISHLARGAGFLVGCLGYLLPHHFQVFQEVLEYLGKWVENEWSLQGAGKGVSFALVWDREAGEGNWKCSGGWDEFSWNPRTFPWSQILGGGCGWRRMNLG